MTAAMNPATVGQAAELAVRAVDALMTWEHQAPRADLTAEDLAGIARQLRSAAALIDPSRTPRVASHGFELTDAGREAVEAMERDDVRHLLVLVPGGAQ